MVLNFYAKIQLPLHFVHFFSRALADLELNLQSIMGRAVVGSTAPGKEGTPSVSTPPTAGTSTPQQQQPQSQQQPQQPPQEEQTSFVMNKVTKESETGESSQGNSRFSVSPVPSHQGTQAATTANEARANKVEGAGEEGISHIFKS